MKQTRNIARRWFASILVLLMATLTLESVALAGVDPSWVPTGSMNTARVDHTATLLPNGKVLVVGGYNYEGGGDLNSAELYDPATGTWSTTGSLNRPRTSHTATLIQNGKVLVAGGELLVDEGSYISVSAVANAELYDPSTETWSNTGNQNTARFYHTATLLPNGEVLVAGGAYPGPPVGPAPPGAFKLVGLNSAELYDPATGRWRYTGELHTLHAFHAATLLQNGKILVVAGTDSVYNYPSDQDVTNKAELYDLATESWSIAANVNAAREFHTATRLQNGQVLIAGGDNTANTLNSAELYDSPVQLVAAVLPSSRSVQVGTPATAFATIINTDSNMATSCTISPITSIPATLTYQATDPATNQLTGSQNTPVDIPAGAAQSLVFALTPTAPMAPTDIQLSFDCANTDPAPIISGLNTLLLSASATPTPDLLALVATPTNDGIVNISGPNGVGVFAVATVNVGAGDTLTVSADAGGAALPVNISICQTDPQTSACLSPPASSVTTMIFSHETPTFGVFVAAQEDISFFPEINRIFVRFKDSSDVTRGLTSVAVRTQ